ncbi:MAG: hypothetical protein Q8867_03425, partial [Bacteroidota bacterium]|nr:hypothetical protein [Bacteroidota bacterium]
MKRLLPSVLGILFLWTITVHAQNIPTSPAIIQTGKFLGVSKPLRDLPILSHEEFLKLEKKGRNKELNEGLKKRYYPYAATALPKGADPAWQHEMGKNTQPKAPLINFEGQASPFYPPDCNGACGPNHYIQMVNCTYAIYSKSGALLAGPTQINQIFGSVSGSGYNDGDPIVLYDEQADRWLITEFSISGNPDYILMAISTTGDPTGTYYQYSFILPTTPDYPKFGVWQDGYYLGVNNGTKNDIF